MVIRGNKTVIPQDVVAFERKLSKKWGKKRAFLPFSQMTSGFGQMKREKSEDKQMRNLPILIFIYARFYEQNRKKIVHKERSQYENNHNRRTEKYVLMPEYLRTTGGRRTHWKTRSLLIKG